MEPKIGDKIRITKSIINWSSCMDKFDGKEFIIIDIITQNNDVIFKGYEGFQWRYVEKHFKIVNQNEPQYEIY